MSSPITTHYTPYLPPSPSLAPLTPYFTLPYIKILIQALKNQSTSTSNIKSDLFISTFIEGESKPSKRQTLFRPVNNINSLISHPLTHLLQIVFNILDRKKHGEINLFHLSTMLILLCVGGCYEKLYILFKLFDSDNDECLTLFEVFNLIHSIRLGDLTKNLDIDNSISIIMNEERAWNEADRIFQIIEPILNYNQSISFIFITIDSLWSCLSSKQFIIDMLFPRNYSLDLILEINNNSTIPKLNLQNDSVNFCDEQVNNYITSISRYSITPRDPSTRRPYTSPIVIKRNSFNDNIHTPKPKHSSMKDTNDEDNEKLYIEDNDNIAAYFLNYDPKPPPPSANPKMSHPIPMVITSMHKNLKASYIYRNKIKRSDDVRSGGRSLLIQNCLVCHKSHLLKK